MAEDTFIPSRTSDLIDGPSQPLDSDLTAIAALDASTSGTIATDGAGWIKKTYAQFKTALGLVKADVGLGSVDNTADAAKSVASAAVLTTARTIDGQPFDGSANVTVVAPGIHAAASKATPVDADELGIVDSAAANVLKKLTLTNLKAFLKTYFDTLYVSSTGAVTSVFTRTGAVVAASGDYLASQVTNAADKIASTAQSFAAGIVSTHATQGIGYATGAGGAVTQGTSRSTGVTLNKITGQITTFNSSISSGVQVVFTVTNSAVAIGDTVIVNIQNDLTSAAAQPLQGPYVAKVQNGSFVIVYTNNSSASVSTAFVINFTIIKAVAS